MFTVAQKEFGGDVDIVCPGAGVYEPVRPTIRLSTYPALLIHN